MLLKVLRSKLHRAVVTEARLDYVGSLTIDENLMDMAGIIHHESVLVANVDNGERFETYAIPGPRGSGVICVNGAAAHLAGPGHRLIVMCFGYADTDEAAKLKPRVLVLDADNRPVK